MDRGNKLSGITCYIDNCIYHGGQDSCCAGHIEVSGSACAQNCEETVCATFADEQ